MRFQYLMVTAFVATAFAACAGTETEDGSKKQIFGTVCEARCACEACSPENTKLCKDEQDSIAAHADQKSCTKEAEAYDDCVRLEGRCVNDHYLAEVCNVQAAALAGCLDPSKNCPTAGDGICDEPEGTDQCAEGTDPADCLAPCPSTGNGICDEPEGTGVCPAGTDVDDCKLTPCDSVNNGVCDEPEGTDQCEEGTDVVDCRVPTCDSVNDGRCDEPEGSGLCPEGTDTADCGVATCNFVNDGICDEPEGTGRCAEGTDVVDCRVSACNFVNDGVCDEPEGTGRCAEGTDVVDCRGATSCDNLGICGTSTSGCTACAFDGVCAPQLAACNSSASCINFETCIQDCVDQACMDTCSASNPSGASLYSSLFSCVICDQCFNSCSGSTSGC